MGFANYRGFLTVQDARALRCVRRHPGKRAETLLVRDGGIESFGSKEKVELRGGDVVSFRLAGEGGYGHPRERDGDAVRGGVAGEFVSERGDHPPDRVSAEEVEQHVQVEVRPAFRSEQARVGSDPSALSSFERWVSPARPPNRTCSSHRIRLSLCLCRPIPSASASPLRRADGGGLSPPQGSRAPHGARCPNSRFGSVRSRPARAWCSWGE